MLIKLIKYDLLFSRKSFFIFSGIFLVATIVARLTLPSLRYVGELSMIFGVSAIFIVAGLILGFVSIAMVYQNYNKSFFTDHGYLLFTLPVKPSLMLLSKFITSLIWFNYVIIVGVIATFTMLSMLQGVIPYQNIRIYDVINVIYYVFIANTAAFFLISIFFLGINLKNTFNIGTVLNWVVSAGIVFAIFYAWAWLLNWGSGISIWQIQFGTVYEWDWSSIGANFQNGSTLVLSRDYTSPIDGAYAVTIDLFVLGLPILMGSIVTTFILGLFKRIELK